MEANSSARTTPAIDAPRVVFLLSPVNSSGRRVTALLDGGSDHDVAARLRTRAGVALGELFSFISGLYFRGKLEYARRFVRPPRGCEGVLIIAPGRGLLSPEARCDRRTLRAISATPVDPDDERYTKPLRRDARRLARRIGARDRVVLLGSVATTKYVEPLLDALGDRLHFPAEFVGRGNMSRGGLLLRRVESGVELETIPARSAPRRGKRPPRLEARGA